MSDPKKFPGMRWHPVTGENEIFHTADDVPEGYLDYHPSNPPEGAAKVVADDLPLSRAEIVAHLTDGGVKFKAKADTTTLYVLLATKLKEHLATAEIEIPTAATVPELLALVPKPE